MSEKNINKEKVGNSKSTKETKALKHLSRKKIIISVVIFVFLAIAIPTSYYFYNQYMNIPNFNSPENNLVKVSKSKAQPGEELAYIITIKNEGRRPVTHVKIKTEIPENTIFINSDSEFSEETEKGKIYFLIDRLEVKEEKNITYTVEIESPLDANTIISNSTFEIEYRRYSSNQTIIKKFPINLKTIIESEPNFSKSSYKFIDVNEGYLRIGDEIKIVLNIKNTGNMNARNITIENIIPENTSYIAQSFVSNLAYLEMEREKYLIKINKLNVNEYAYINYSVRVKEGLQDQAKIIFSPYINSNLNNYTFVKGELTVRAFPDISNFSISSEDENGGDLLVGDTLNYTISITNSGDGNANNIKIVNIIPEYTSFISTTLDSSIFSWDQNKDRFTVSIPVLKPGQSLTYNYRVAVNNAYFGTKIVNYAVASGDNFDEINSNSVANIVISNYSYNVAVLGDSQVEKTLWVSVLRQLMEQNYPYGDFNFYVSGKSGETITKGYERMISEGILGINPYIFIINYGTNDAFAPYGRLRTSLDRFSNTLSTMIDTIRNSTGAMIVVMSTAPSTEELHPYHTNVNLSSINNVAKQVCTQKSVVFVDVFNPMIQTGNPDQFLSDGLHYNDRGSQFVATIAFNTISKYLNKYGVR